jgi:nucleoside phosphorylase
MGQVEAGLLTTDVIQTWRPIAAVLVGIAAAADKSVRLGDVVVGRYVWYYENAKILDDSTKPQPAMIPANVSFLRHLAGVSEWNCIVPVVHPNETSDKPKTHSGVIASGEKVIANEYARDQIAASNRRILAIDMEGYGFSYAMWNKQLPHISIRGISDDASSSKDDKWRRYAAGAAAAFTRHFLSDLPIEWVQQER